MEQTKYDVFISYSRKDYVDVKGNPLPDSILSKIKNVLKSNDISYWFDEEGIYSGDEFASVITKAIRMSRIFLFISSVNSNQSKWTSNEISTALEFNKIIIPFRLDNSPYNDSVMMKIVSFDYIECKDEEKAMIKLLRAVKHHLPKHEETVSLSEEEKPSKELNDNRETKTYLLSSKLKKTRIMWAIILISLLVIIGLIVFSNKGQGSKNPSDMATILVDSNDTICQSIDLGLPSGTLWGDRNVGAKCPTDFGILYAWGEIKAKHDYSSSKYVEQLKPGEKLTGARRDAATAELGDEWVMPTEAQFKELLSECQWTWKKINGHNGYEVIGKNGNSIFLPASGWSCDTTFQYRNQYGYYWTSERTSLHSQFARSLQFPKDGKGIVGNGYLYVGRSVRAVYKYEAVAE